MTKTEQMMNRMRAITLSDIEFRPEDNCIAKVHLRAHDVQATYLIVETSDDEQTPYTFLMYEHSDPKEAPCISLSCAHHEDAANKMIQQYIADNVE